MKNAHTLPDGRAAYTKEEILEFLKVERTKAEGRQHYDDAECIERLENRIQENAK